MYSLFIDTHASNIVICLFKDNKLLRKEIKESVREHSVYTLPMIKELLNDFNLNVRDLSLLLVVNGPGSFTGVRIGVTIAKTIAYSLNIPIKLISSLLVKAINVSNDIKKVSLVDRHGAFIASFNSDLKLIEDYRYVNTSLYNELNANNEYVENIEVDYEKVIAFADFIEPVNPHSANPLYVKNVEVNKIDKAN
ncbi:MAG: tRNA (adenosine(37)-N6)-threonylcarbamoyltransferase complex dimerization subunit type 1 TsaB [Bacilli bacterium]